MCQSVKADLKHPNDVLFAFLHWRLVANKLRCVGLGQHFDATADGPMSETLPEQWHRESDANYETRYRREDDGTKFVLRLIKAGDSVVATLVRFTDDAAEAITLKTADVIDAETKEVRDKGALQKLVDEKLLETLVIKSEKKEEAPTGGTAPRRNPLLEEGPHLFPSSTPPGRLIYPQIGGSDLDPLGRSGGGGMIFPHEPRLGPGHVGPRPRHDVPYPHISDPFGESGFGDEMAPPQFGNPFGGRRGGGRNFPDGPGFGGFM